MLKFKDSKEVAMNAEARAVFEALRRIAGDDGVYKVIEAEEVLERLGGDDLPAVGHRMIGFADTLDKVLAKIPAAHNQIVILPFAAKLPQPFCQLQRADTPPGGQLHGKRHAVQIRPQKFLLWLCADDLMRVPSSSSFPTHFLKGLHLIF